MQLSLIAGAPQSFIQPLSVPYYSRRPEIGLPEEAQLTPQTHESGDERLAEDNAPAAKVPVTAGVAGMIGRGSGSGIGAGSGSNFGGGLMAMKSSHGDVTQTVSVSAAAPMMYEQAAMDLRRFPNASTAAFDDYFAYNLTEPITIRKNESALVPILQTKIDAERADALVAAKPPRRSARSGSPTPPTSPSTAKLFLGIVEDGNFGGEGLLDPHPSRRKTPALLRRRPGRPRIHRGLQRNTTHAVSITAAKGILQLHHSDFMEITYVVHNAATDARIVVVERPIHQGYTAIRN